MLIRRNHQKGRCVGNRGPWDGTVGPRPRLSSGWDKTGTSKIELSRNEVEKYLELVASSGLLCLQMMSKNQSQNPVEIFYGQFSDRLGRDKNFREPHKKVWSVDVIFQPSVEFEGSVDGSGISDFWAQWNCHSRRCSKY